MIFLCLLCLFVAMQRVTGRGTRSSPLWEIASPRGGRARLCPYARLAMTSGKLFAPSVRFAPLRYESLHLCSLCALLSRRKTHTSNLVLYFLCRLCLFVAIQKSPGWGITRCLETDKERL